MTAEINPQDEEYYREIERITQLFNARDYMNALDICEATLKNWPDRPEGIFILGVLAYQLGKQGRALSLFENAHAMEPNCRDYAEALATVHTEVGNLNEGLYFAKLTLTMEPHPRFRPLVPGTLSDYFGAIDKVKPPTHYVNAVRLFNQRLYDQAIEACGSELEINANHPDCHQLLGRALNEIGEYDRATAAFHAAIYIAADNPLDYVYLGQSLTHLGRFSEALACHERARALAPKDSQIHAAAMSGLVYQADEIWANYRKRAASWSRAKATPRKDKPRRAFESVPGRKIRVGYLSNAFFKCPQQLFVDPIFNYHDRNRFEIFCYQDFLTKDSVTTRLENLAHSWRNIFEVDTVTASYMIEGDDLDILVDLSGYGEGARLDLLAARPAPVQVAWLGIPEAAAFPGIDYVLSDRVTASHDAKTCLKDQETVVLDHGLVSVSPFVLYPDVDEQPAKSNDCITFGGVCDLARLTPAVASAWSRVLMAVPGSRLVLGYVDNISWAVRDAVGEIFAHYGVGGRVLFQEAEQGDEANLRFLALIDVMLDTFPVSGDIETCEALWMGVPVITLAGKKRRAGLMTASILRAAGREDWVTATENQYVKRAVKMAKDLSGLEAIRRELRGEVQESPLFDPQGFVKDLEKAYLTLVRREA